MENQARKRVRLPRPTYRLTYEYIINKQGIIIHVHRNKNRWKTYMYSITGSTIEFIETNNFRDLKLATKYIQSTLTEKMPQIAKSATIEGKNC